MTSVNGSVSTMSSGRMTAFTKPSTIPAMIAAPGLASTIARDRCRPRRPTRARSAGNAAAAAWCDRTRSGRRRRRVRAALHQAIGSTWRVDWSQFEGPAALRCTVGVALPLVAGLVLGQQSAGVFGAVGARVGRVRILPGCLSQPRDDHARPRRAAWRCRSSSDRVAGAIRRRRDRGRRPRGDSAAGCSSRSARRRRTSGCNPAWRCSSPADFLRMPRRRSAVSLAVLAGGAIQTHPRRRALAAAAVSRRAARAGDRLSQPRELRLQDPAGIAHAAGSAFARGGAAGVPRSAAVRQGLAGAGPAIAARRGGADPRQPGRARAASRPPPRSDGRRRGRRSFAMFAESVGHVLNEIGTALDEAREPSAPVLVGSRWRRQRASCDTRALVDGLARPASDGLAHRRRDDRLRRPVAPNRRARSVRFVGCRRSATRSTRFEPT